MNCDPILDMRLSQADLKAVFERNKQLAQLNPGYHMGYAETKSFPAGKPSPDSIRTTTDIAKLNKTERAYWMRLRLNQQTGLSSGMWIGVQCITLKLADDTRYTPDFWTLEGSQIVAHEVKGFWRDDAKVKIKVAARIFPWIEFVVVTKQQNNWNIQVLKP